MTRLIKHFLRMEKIEMPPEELPMHTGKSWKTYCSLIFTPWWNVCCSLYKLPWKATCPLWKASWNACYPFERPLTPGVALGKPEPPTCPTNCSPIVCPQILTHNNHCPACVVYYKSIQVYKSELRGYTWGMRYTWVLGYEVCVGYTWSINQSLCITATDGNDALEIFTKCCSELAGAIGCNGA